MLGHASITLTLDTYSHVLPGMQEESSDVLFGEAYVSLHREYMYEGFVPDWLLFAVFRTRAHFACG